MKSITYVGPFARGVEVEPDPKSAPGVWVTVKPGESIDVAGSVADSLAEQECWEITGASNRPRANGSLAAWQAFAEGLGLDVAGLTKGEIVALVDEPLTTVSDQEE